MIKIECFPLGEIEANCYFVTDPEAKVSLLVDMGDASGEVEEKVRQFGADRLQYLLLTHGHFDHIGYAAQMKQKFPNMQIVIGKEDADFTNDDRLNLAGHFGLRQEHFTADILAEEGSELAFGTETVKVLATPGHTRGGVCYVLGNSIFTGDTLFRGSVGRTDFPTSSTPDMLRSVKKLAELDGNYHLYCGHGADTTLDFERKNNMFMREDSYDNLY